MTKRVPDIEKLYNSYSRKLYFTSLRITANSFDAQEAMHDTFIKFYKLKEKENIERIDSWLTSVCIRISIDILRKRYREGTFKSELQKEITKEELIEEPPSSKTKPEEYTIEAVKESLLLLPDGYRLILSLHLFEGYDYEEIAQITGLKESSIRSQYMRAKKRLAEMVTKQI
ncbi:MAG: sigma-70 family RNA polymerase sigma factor [Bacteroidales bacterium]|nr:sigma-70 family RNA polymerase sigma factor [Bacteroidales bacterium]